MDSVAIWFSEVTPFDNSIGDLVGVQYSQGATFNAKHHSFATQVDDHSGFLQSSESLQKDIVQMSCTCENIGAFEFVERRQDGCR